MKLKLTIIVTLLLLSSILFAQQSIVKTTKSNSKKKEVVVDSLKKPLTQNTKAVINKDIYSGKPLNKNPKKKIETDPKVKPQVLPVRNPN